ncbi:hypothetical protein MKW98_007846 [Papaver atlanticum]|uniref:Uncharacterized protein n=1 Tax=Papaver atlanticum TaxID=357466 RepID=A0AAD4RYE7_9MAGN|nr:hypothetical protein MKW98_007846 [Papaver atlanticum]
MAKISASSLLGFFLVLAVLFATQAQACTEDTVLLDGTCDQCAARCLAMFPVTIVGSLCIPVTGTVQCGCCVLRPKI